MLGSRTLATTFVAVIGLAALFCVGFAIMSMPQLGAAEAVLATTFTLLFAVATLRTIHFDYRLSLDLTTMVIIAAVLTLEPSIAICAAAIGVIGGQILLRPPLTGIAFNSSQIILQVFVAVTVMAAFGWDATNPAFDDARYLPVMALAMIAVFLTNTVLVSCVVGLQARMAPWLVWRDALSIDLLIEQVTQFALGVVAAVVISVQVLILPLLIAPGLMIYIATNRKSLLQYQTHEAIDALADLVDQRDPFTADHSRRVAIVAREIATQMNLPPDEITAVERAARVHDLGKFVIDLALLNKPVPLTTDEWQLFRRHPVDGASILSWFPEFRSSTAYVRHHHERWDGSGYPDGLAGASIPLGARVLAVADAFDAMSSARPYRAPLKIESIIAELEAFRGVQWDEAVVDALTALIENGTIEVSNSGNAVRVFDGLGSLIQTS